MYKYILKIEYKFFWWYNLYKLIHFYSKHLEDEDRYTFVLIPAGSKKIYGSIQCPFMHNLNEKIYDNSRPLF